MLTFTFTFTHTHSHHGGTALSAEPAKVMAQPCFQLPQLPLGAAPTSCTATTFACSHCQRTCGFCVAVNGSSCEDRLPATECERVLTNHPANRVVRRVNSSVAHGYCNAVIAPSSPLHWSLSDGRLTFSEENLAHEELGRHVPGWPPRSLAGRTTYFMGDSNTRYQYLSLAMMLSSGSYPRSPRDAAFSICSESSTNVSVPLSKTTVPWRSNDLNASHAKWLARRGVHSTWLALKWAAFHNQSTTLLEGHEVCECNQERGMENRWFELGSARLAFLKLSGPSLLSLVREEDTTWSRGFSAVRRAAGDACAKSLLSPQCKATPQGFNGWTNVTGRMRHLLREGDALVLGMGPWYTPADKDLDELRRFMHAVKQLVGASGHAIFKSCPRGAVSAC